jgi:bacterioferritin-associated ferredoxin
MYVCICRAVTDTDIREAVQNGCCSMRDLRNCLGVATQCGRCALTARDVLNESLEEAARDIAGAA